MDEDTTQKDVSKDGLRQKLHTFCDKECTFFRLHLTAFSVIPLIASGIFYASNGQYPVKYIDALFLCYSAMTETGLGSVNLSTVTGWQQAILYILMLIGDITIVSWIMVLVRKRYFRNHCEYVVAEHIRKKNIKRLHRSRTAFIQSIAAPISLPSNQPPVQQELSPPTLVADANGDRTAVNSDHISTTTNARLSNDDLGGLTLQNVGSFKGIQQYQENESASKSDQALFSVDGAPWTSSPTNNPMSLSPVSEGGHQHVEFAVSSAVPVKEGHYRRFGVGGGHMPNPRRSYTMLSQRSRRAPTLPGTTNTQSTDSNKYRGFGGFPGPLQLLYRLTRRAAPKTYKRFKRSMTLSSVRTLEGSQKPYLDFDLTTGRNSDFRIDSLTDEQLELLGGTEYRALRWLSYIVPLYFLGTQLISYLIFGPWLATTSGYDAVFEAQPRLVNKTWFSIFQVMSAYTGGGFSLVDMGMVPFQTTYIMIFPIMFVILAGNHALPIFLRFAIWVGSKLANRQSDAYASLSFLLDHPRRCFLYLFPSHQTWFLLIAMVAFSVVEWASFAILDQGLVAYESLPVGVQAIGGLFQGIAARASGMAIVPIANFAPSLLFLYIVMMYIAVYPVAMSIRSTNVYEERSLGVFEVSPDDEDEEPEGLEKIKDRRERVGKYVLWHIRHQMSIDIWWLVCGVFLIAIIERNNIMDPEKPWFDLFRILFELVSAFGGIGLSIGFPNDNFSFTGAMRPLSKLVIIVIMVRGRHRGLPVAVDRAVVLPRDMVPTNNTDPKMQEKTEPQNLYSDFNA